MLLAQLAQPGEDGGTQHGHHIVEQLGESGAGATCCDLQLNGGWMGKAKPEEGS